MSNKFFQGGRKNFRGLFPPAPRSYGPDSKWLWSFDCKHCCGVRRLQALQEVSSLTKTAPLLAESQAVVPNVGSNPHREVFDFYESTQADWWGLGPNVRITLFISFFSFFVSLLKPRHWRFKLLSWEGIHFSNHEDLYITTCVTKKIGTKRTTRAVTHVRFQEATKFIPRDLFVATCSPCSYIGEVYKVVSGCGDFICVSVLCNVAREMLVKQ